MGRSRFVRRRLLVAVLLLAGGFAGTAPPGAAQPEPEGGSGWLAVDAGEDHTCGIKNTGQLFCWGRDDFQQLGDGGSTTNRQAPRAVATFFTDWVQVAAGTRHTCALRATGRLYCWGSDLFEALGNGFGQGDKSAPYQVAGGYTDWESVDVSSFNTCGIRAGRAYCWGSDSENQLGNGGPEQERATPTQVNGFTNWAEVEIGSSQACGRRDSGRLYCWGRDGTGVLGNGPGRADASSPEQVIGAHTDWTSFSVGLLHVCGIRGVGDRYCWGFNPNRELGIGLIPPSPPSWVQVPTLVLGGFSDWSITDASHGLGAVRTCGIRGGGALYCAGADAYGAIGDGPGDTGPHNAPRLVAGPSGYTAVTGGQDHACGLRGDKLYCWGRDHVGQLGNGTSMGNRSAPTEITA